MHEPTTNTLDRAGRTAQARIPSPCRPMPRPDAWVDSLSHLGREAARLSASVAMDLAGIEQGPQPAPDDHRSNHPGWPAWPFRLWNTGFLAQEA
ncbi:hypothetical protein [Maliponia aquimaris]|nr:hypothetical protein [Maliponia aquimaris]